MSALKKAYKWLTGSANKAAKAQKKKREKTAPKPKGSSRGSAGAKKAQAKSNAKVKEKTKEKVRELTNSVGSQKSGKAKSGGTTGTQAHRSGAVSRNNGTNRPQTRSGAISSSTANQRRAGAQKASSNLKSGGMKVTDVFKKDNEKWKQNQTEKAKLTSQGKITATGGRTKTHTGTWGNPVGKSITDVASEVATRTRYNTGVISETAKASKKNQKKYEKETGHKLSKEEKREWLKDDLKSANKYISSREGKKEINKAVKEAKKSNQVKGGTYKAKDLTNEDYIRLQDTQRLGVKKGNKALGKDLARKIGSMKAYSTNKNTAARVTTGVMQGLSYGDVLNGTVGTLGKNEKKAIKEAKESGAYNLGYGAGMLGSFALSGTSGVGKAIAGGTSKAAAKGAAKATTKSAAKKFVQNRVGELAAETPLNITDAAKMAVDENGKVDKKKFAGYLGLNTALTGGAGAAIEGAGMKFTKRNVNKYIELAAKQKTSKLTAEEGALFKKLQTRLSRAAEDVQAAKSNSAYEGLTKGNDNVMEARLKRKARAAAIKYDRPIKVGKATTIDHPYVGKMPVHNGKRGNVVPIDDNAVKKAQTKIDVERSKKPVRDFARNLLGKGRSVSVKNTTMNGEKYDVYIGPRAVKKVVNYEDLTSQQVAIFQNIDDVISNAEYLDSGRYVPRKGKKPNPNVKRYDYFETNVTSGGEDFVVSFDVEVFNHANNYRTHKVTNLDIIPSGKKTETSGLAAQNTATRSSASSLDVSDTIPNNSTEIKAQDKSVSVEKPDDELDPRQQELVNRGRNRATQKYVDDVTERNRQYVNDRELTGRNADVIANSDDPKAGLSNNADSSKLKEGVTVDKKQAEKSKANVHERLVSYARNPEKYTEAEAKDIDETVDKISNMIANGDESSARAESRELARKYGQVDEEQYMGHDEVTAEAYRDGRSAIRNTVFRLPVTEAERGRRGSLKDFKEVIGLGNTRDVDIRKGKYHTKLVKRGEKGKDSYYIHLDNKGIDDFWDEMSKINPTAFPEEITGVEDRFRRIVEVAQSRDHHFDDYYPLPDEELDEIYDDLARDIYDQSLENANKFRTDSELTVKKTEPKNKPQEELESVKSEIQKLKKQKENASDEANSEIKKLAEEKGFPLESSRSTGSDSYIKDIDNEIEALTKRQSELEKELGITKPGDTKDDLKNLDDMSWGELEKEIRSTEIHLNKAKDKYGPDAPRVKQLEEHLAEAKKKDSELEAELKKPVKKSEWTEQEKESKPVGIEALDNERDAPGIKMTSEEKISKDLDKTRAELKEATEKYGKDSVRAQEAQGRIDELEARLEDAKHEAETGQKTNNSSDPPREHDDGGFTYDEPRTRLGKVWQSFYRTTVDSFADIEKMAKKIGGEKGQRLLAQTNAVRNAKNIAANWITGGRTNWNRESVGKSLDSIFKGLNGKGKQAKRADFIDYCYHKHNVERVKNDAPITGMPREADESLQAIKDYEAKYGDEIKNFQDDVVKYCDDLLQYKVDAGIVSKAEADRLRKYQNYIPTFTRQDMKQMVEESSKTGIMVDRGLRKAVGGSEDGELIDLYEQIAQSTRSTMKHCEMNEMIRMVADIQGIKYSDLSRKVSPDDVLENSLFTEASNGKYYATYYDDEGAHTVDIPEEIYKGIGEWSGEEKANLIKYLSIGGTLNVPGRMFKNLITGWNPIFAARNGIRDFATALTYTKDLRGFAKAYPKAVKEVIMHKGPYYDAFIAAGGKFSSLTKSGGADGFLTTLENSKLSPLHYITEFNDAIETLPRMAEFISTIDKAGGPKGAGKAVIDRAMRNANDVTLNFGRSGIITRAFNSGAVPYLNPSVQGLDKLARVFTEAKQEKNMRGLISLGMKMSTFAVAPAVFNEWMLKDNKDYQQLNTRDKDSNYFIPIGDGKFVKIPKARELVVVAEPAQYFFRHAQFGDSGGWKQMFQSAVDNIGVVNPLTDSLFSPIHRAVTNKTWFGGDIESAYEVENMLPQDRFDEGTSLLAIDLAQKQPAKALKLSPKKIDNLIDSYTGVIGDIFLPMNAKAAKGNPFVMKFVTDSVFSNKLSTEAWEKYERAQQISNSKTIDPDKVAKAKQESQDIYNLYLGDTVTLGQAISDIQNDNKLTKAQKHDLVRELKKSQNEIYRASENNGVPKLDGKEVDPLKAIYNLYNKQKDKKDKAVGIAMKYAADTYKEPYEKYKKSEEYTKMSGKDRSKQRVKYLNYVVGIRSTQGKIGEDKGDKFLNYKTAAVVGKMKNASDGMLDSFGIYKYQQENAETYKKKKYSLKHYIDTEKINLKSSRKLGFEYRSKMENWNVSMAQAHKKRDDGSYFIGDKKPEFQKGRMPAARYLVKKNAKQWSEKEIDNFAKKHDYTYKQEPYPEYDKVYKQAKKDYGDKFSDLECKALAQVITGAGDNDFGNTKMKNDTGIFDGIEDGDNRGGSGRRGYGRRGGRGGRGGGSSSGGTVPKTASGAIKGKVTDPFGKTTNGSKKSNLNDAYRKKYAKLIKESRKKH